MTTESPNTLDPEEEYLGLRCNRCNKPITPAEAVLTPTGYRCRDCLRQQQKVFDNTQGLDVVVGFVISMLIALAGSWLSARISYLVILLAPGVGLLIYNAVRLAVKRRRSRALSIAILAGAIAGALPVLALTLYYVFTSPAAVPFSSLNFLPLIWQAAYAVIVPSSAYLQSKGGR